MGWLLSLFHAGDFMLVVEGSSKQVIRLDVNTDSQLLRKYFTAEFHELHQIIIMNSPRMTLDTFESLPQTLQSVLESVLESSSQLWIDRRKF